MRTVVLVSFLAATACGVAPSTAAPEAPQADPAAAERRTLAEAYARTAYLRGEILKLQAELDALTDQVGTLSKQVDGQVAGLTSATVDLGTGTCASTREAGSGMATGRRQYQPLIVHRTGHVWGDPHEERGDPVHGVDVKLGVVDADLDGTVDYVVLESDLDGDGFSDLIELGGDRDRDGDLDDDALEADQRHERATGLVCGATDHL